MNFITISDCKDPDDPQGRTYREVNAAKTHTIPIGALVEIGDPKYPANSDGVRLFVVAHTRDCDQTPLYELCADPEDTVVEKSGFRNAKWIGGFQMSSLKVVRWARTLHENPK